MEYKTTDMNLAAVLALSFQIKQLINNSGRGTFVFEDNDDLQEMVTAFWNKQLQIEPNLLFDSLKIIKNRLYNDVKGEK